MISNDYDIIFVIRGHNAAVLCVQFDDRKIVSGSYDKTIKVSNKLLKLEKIRLFISNKGILPAHQATNHPTNKLKISFCFY